MHFASNKFLNQAVYITMPDDIKIAADIWLPKTGEQGQQFPLVVEFTRYWRIAENAASRDWIDFFNEQGFAYARVDCRGSGASFGTRENETSVAETQDFSHVINWFARQSWSNGAVASTGISYSGNTAEHTMIDAPVALKATIPRFNDFDLYSSVMYPGGVSNTDFLIPWSNMVKGLDRNTIEAQWLDMVRGDSVKPVDEDVDKTLLQQAVQEHANNYDIATLNKSPYQAVFREDWPATGSLQSPQAFALSPHLTQHNTRLREIPSYHWASFTDAGTAQGAIARFMGSDAPMKVVIGYWTHGAIQNANPYQPAEKNTSSDDVSPSIRAQYLDITNFLKPLKNPEKTMSGGYRKRELYYFTAGENIWKKTDIWPIRNTQNQRFYFAENASLMGTAPQNKAPQDKQSKDTYRVNYKAGTGNTTRWSTQIGGGAVNYENRAEADKLLLIYTSEPLNTDIEITGHPVIYLQMSSTETDGAVIVYLEDVAPDGTVTMLTEGELRLIHRKASTKKPPYPQFGPYHSFERKDALPMQPGKVAEIGFDLLPLSVQVKAGHALRIAIAGHDKDSFERVLEHATPTYEFYRNAELASFIDIPVVPANSSIIDNPF